MAPILLNILASLMVVSFTSAGWTDLFDPLFRTLDYDEEFDYVKPGRCRLYGCTRPPDRVCKGPLQILRPIGEVEDKNKKNEPKWKKGVKNCAKLCKEQGELSDGNFACDSFNYIYNKTSSSNCVLYKGFPDGVLGSRPGSTRIDYSGNYCYTREERRCVGSNCPPQND